MARGKDSRIPQIGSLLISSLRSPSLLAFIPALCLAGYWFGGEGTLIFTAALLPLVYLAIGRLAEAAPRTRDPFLDADQYRRDAGALLARAQETGRSCAAFSLWVEEYDTLVEHHGKMAADRVVRAAADRINDTLRDSDLVAKSGPNQFLICIAPVRQLDLESCLQIAGRLQTAIEEPVSVDGTILYASCAIGFCQSERSPGTDSATWLEAAETALQVARRTGTGGIRAYSDRMQAAGKGTNSLRQEVTKALDSGQIRPWYQPQLSTDTGQITGFEALARWQHPARGLISPADFLPAVEECDLLERLAEVMLYHALAALREWDARGLKVPCIGVNFAGSELGNPGLVDKIRWELDRFELTPDRLAVEVLETVVTASPDDTVSRNINALGEMGCLIDLDDFGTGQASLGAIRRFGVKRIKIDRSFVTRVDQDPQQRRMIGAILNMAERLELETLAEGVENAGEHAVLAQLGCDHVQGFGIACPMPFEETLAWMENHLGKLRDMPRIGTGGAG